MSRFFLACCGTLAVVSVVTAQPKTDLPKLPDEKVVEAWEKGGAEHGAISWSETQTRRIESKTRPAEKPGEVPAFLVTPETKLAGLEEPAVPFGLVLRKGTGDDQLKALPSFKNLRYVLAYGQPLTDVGAKELARQTGLRYLDIGRVKMTSAGMKHLATLPELETLHVDSVRIGNAGLAELAKIKTLRDLNLDGTGVTYEALAGLVALQDLETLGLLDVKAATGKAAGFGDWVSKLPKLRKVHTSAVTDADLKQFAGSKSLRVLECDAKSVTAVGVRALAKNPDLEELHLRDAKLTGGYKVLTAFTKLRRLVLLQADVTDADLDVLVGLSELRELSLRETKVTADGVARLKKSLPNLEVEK